MKSFWIVPATLLITGCSGIEKITTVLIEAMKSGSSVTRLAAVYVINNALRWSEVETINYLDGNKLN